MYRTLAYVFLCMVLLGGCEGGFQANVEASGQISAFSETDARLMCESEQAYYNEAFPPAELQRSVCVGRGLVASRFVAGTCEATMTSCVAEEGASSIDLDCEDADVWSLCDATVAQYEACITAETDAMRVVFDEILQVGCDADGDLVEISRVFTVPAVPAECSSLSVVCPSLSGGNRQLRALFSVID